MGEEFPQDPKVQLMEAIKAVFRSWDNPRANYYRMMNDIPYSWGTAVNVQSMVFGNMGNTSGTGVAFTRDPATGAKGIFGEYLINAQGEDVVAGIRTPSKITQLEKDLPECYKQFIISLTLESTIATCRTWSSPSRTASCSSCRPERQAHRSGSDPDRLRSRDEGMITPEEAVCRIEAKSSTSCSIPHLTLKL